MMSNNGRNPIGNPMLYRCDIRGCFNVEKRPKIEVFAECFRENIKSGNIAMSDIDATVEQNGRFLFMEFKPLEGKFEGGQQIYFEKLTRLSDKIVTIVLRGNARTMEISHMKFIYKGEEGGWIPTTLEGVKRYLRDWSGWTVGKAWKSAA
jgi:hypothetical protein